MRAGRHGLAGTALACALLALPAPAVAGDTVRVDPGVARGAINRDLVGFNWRAGGSAVAPLQPRLVRFDLRFSQIAPAPGVFDFGAADAAFDAIEATGATALAIGIERPPWANGAGSAGYEAAWREAVRHFTVDRVAAGHRAVWFESGNEPEFPPTSHGQFLTDLVADGAAQARAVRAVEQAHGVKVTWGGPGSLIPDPVATLLLATGARIGGRLPDFVSWHQYTNLPFLGPDAPEDTSSPLALGVWQLLKGTNPVADPAMLGLGAQVARLSAQIAGLPRAKLLLTEWNLSSGGLDRRNDTSAGAAHATAALTVLQDARIDGAMFFAAVDRHCTSPAPCGDWGTATTGGVRKPVWWAFAAWNELARGRRVAVSGGAIASRDGETVRVLLSNFSPSGGRARAITLAGLPGSGTIRRIDSGHDGSAVEPFSGTGVELPANGVALLTFELP